MIDLHRNLAFRLPMMRGRDVVAVQRRLRKLGFTDVGQPDGLYGPATERAVKAFQKTRGLSVDGVLGPVSFGELFSAAERHDAGRRGVEMELGRLSQPHQRFPGSVRWHLDTRGLCVDGGSPEVTGGEPLTVRRVWGEFGPAVEHWCSRYSVPVELVVATICTESGGDPEAARKEPGFTNDASTPHRVSVGLMQTLISTARESLEKPDVDRAWLLIPDNSIRAGTSYIAGQKRKTLFDPPVVACAYNAGSVIENAGAENRWRMKQFPIGTGHHADRYVKWFNDCFRVFSDRAAAGDDVPALSFYRLLRERAAQPADAA